MSAYDFTRRVTGLPKWAREVIEARARALGTDFEEALLASLDLGAIDPLAQSAGWAASRGEPTRVIARRMNYSKSAIDQAARRYREQTR